MAASPIDHVVDEKAHWHITDLAGGVSIPLPNILGFQVTKFMILELIAAGLIILIFTKVAKRAKSGEPPRGLFMNAFESLLTFIRDEVAIPYVGHHDADRFVPFLWTLFLFILFNNLLGMFPFMGSPTASLNVTLALGACAFVVIHGSAIAKHGFLHYLKAHAPHTGLPLWVVFPIVLLIMVIEILGHFIKAFVLGVRLFGNMMGGHIVLAVILSFIVMAKNASLPIFGSVTAISVFGVVALSLLELFVAFLQAYIFTFLTALFLGAALHPEH